MKYGFQDVAERINLSRFIIRRFQDPAIENLTTAERLTLAFEELGPTYVKLGQLLATRPDLVPPSFSAEFKRLQDRVTPFSFAEARAVLNEQYGDYLEVFSTFSETPLASASIAQVYIATLKSGEPVVVKVQRPGIQKQIGEDLQILYWLADLIEKNVEEARIFSPKVVVEELFKTISLETNFIVEANNIKRFQRNFAEDLRVKIPEVYLDYVGEKVLVMEKLNGKPLSQMKEADFQGLDRHELVKNGVQVYFDMVFKHGLFHGDLHSGNLFIMPDGRLGLIDFGVVGRLSERAQRGVAAMFVSLAQEDYDQLALEYVDLAPFSEQTNIEDFARDLRSLIAPYFGLTMKNVNQGKILMDSSAIAAKHKVRLPPDLILFFKSVVTIEGMGHQIIEDFDLLPYVTEFAKDLIQVYMNPKKIFEGAYSFGRESATLIIDAPRQIKQLLRKFNNPDLALKFDFKNFDQFRRTIESSFNTIYLGLLSASLVIAGSIIQVFNKAEVAMPVTTWVFYGLALLLSLTAFFRYILRSWR